jgi:flagellar hook assembly protein FlgD
LTESDIAARGAAADGRNGNVAGSAALGAHGPTGAEVTIYDVAGRVLRRLRYEDLSPGSHRLYWDGRDALGASVASGVYFCRLDLGGGRYSRKMLLIR